MIDFLKTNPFVTKEEYLWEWTVPQVKLSLIDTTHVEYLSEAQAEKEKKNKNAIFVKDFKSLSTDFGIPVFGSKK